MSIVRSLAPLWLSLLVLAAASSGAQAQTVQVKPWFLVIVDTSGSMHDNCTNGATNWPSCTNCAGCAGAVNSCGWSRTRMNDAKCALRNILNSTGDAEFALMQFKHPCRPTCDSRDGADNFADNCDGQMLEPITGNNYQLLEWVDGVCQGSCDGGGYTRELYSRGYTPIAQSLTSARNYFMSESSPTKTDPYVGCRPVKVILLTDGDANCASSGSPNGSVNPSPQAAALLSTLVPTPTGTTTLRIETYPIGFGQTPGDTQIENLAINGGTDAPGPHRGFYAQNEETLSAALNEIIINSQLTEICDGVDNDCDGRIDEDNPKYCDFYGIRTSNPLVPNPDDPSMQVAQSTVDSRVPACSGGSCPAVPGVQGNEACVAPEWASSSMCSPANILCASPGEICNGADDDCDGKIDEDAPAIDDDNEICGDNLDNDCDGFIDEECNGCIPQPEICNDADEDCDTRIDENLTQDCGTNIGECMAGTQTCTAGEWGACSGMGPTPEECDNKDNDCDGVVDSFTEPCGDYTLGLCRAGVRTCTEGAWGACIGNVDPMPEICDGFDNDCDGNPNDDGEDDVRVGLSCGSNVGVCMPGTTVCEAGEVQCVGGTTGSPELCDGLDNDCDNKTDEGVAASDPSVAKPCIIDGGGNVVWGDMLSVHGQCKLGITVCSGGALACLGYVGPQPELCDALDRDCDGDPTNATAMTDPRIGQSCGTSIGECSPGQLVCAGTVLVCNAAPPGVESCNGKDDDCDGLTDENLPASPTPCDTTGHGGVGECQLGQQACIGGVIVCQGEITPTPEICDGKDNNCNNSVDEGDLGGGKSCGSNIGECESGTLVCMGGMLVCPDDVEPTAEICDGKDNDCDGLTDEGNPGGGTSCSYDEDGQDVIGSCRTRVDPTNASQPLDQPCGECRFGTEVCSGGQIVCLGVVGIEPEICDGFDNDCDSPCVLDNTDPQNPVRKCPDDPCNLPTSDPNYLDCDAKFDEGVDQTDPNVGVACVGGSGECKEGTEQCVDGVLECVGGQLPVAELCNGLDDDCDTLVDEGFNIGDPCGNDTGECQSGAFVCDPLSGTAVCEGEVGPIAERCDGLDNDCDGVVDDGNPEGGAACGSSIGACELGAEQCIGGQLVCVGHKPPTPEVCDCIDNDCDGKIDEQGANAPDLCGGGGATCTMCQCAQPCREADEFATPCPTGRVGIDVGGQCHCVAQVCEPASCAAETIELNGQVQCAPNSDRAGACVCRQNQCASRCDGVSCGNGLVCDLTDGRCKESTCLLAQLRCGAGEYCDVAQNECAADACAGSGCGEAEACRDGACFASCAAVSCAVDERCVHGECKPDLCEGTTCDAGQVCNPDSGQCVKAGECVFGGCREGFVCDRISGECDPDPCLRTTCPDGQLCKNGDCDFRCAPPLIDCGGQCFDPMHSKLHCGASGNCLGSLAGETCASEEVCASGKCSDTCEGALLNCGGRCIDPQTDPAYCGATLDCKGENAGGTCGADTKCETGKCVSTAAKSPTDDEDRVAITGGGGCACTVVSAESKPRAVSYLLGFALFSIVVARRRLRALVVPRAGARVRRAFGQVLSLLTLLLVLGAGGCKVETFCLTCTEDTAGNGGGTAGASGTGGSAGTGAGGSTGWPDGGLPPDGGAPDGGKDAAVCIDYEICNGLDDDCDGKIDEDVDPSAEGIDVQTDSRNCGTCGNVCALSHAFSMCEGGKCKIESCDPEYTDLDGDDDTGCEYRCNKYSDDDTLCNMRDDDCDGKIDEDVNFQTDPNHCGACNVSCNRPHATGVPCQAGVCVLMAQNCDTGYYDVDGNELNGCEYQCTPQNGGVELCNKIDDDCDKKIDEGVAATDDRVGVACGNDVGECIAGTQICVAGAIVCSGGKGPSIELCNGVDDDCDDGTDETFPQLGLPCGTDLGECVRGNQQCQSGVLTCVGGVGPTAELCNGKDDDCDGYVDEVDPVTGPPQGVGSACVTLSGGVLDLNPATAVGRCEHGTAVCMSGLLVCMGEIGPQPEQCDPIDWDCDGDPVNGVEMTDPLIGGPCGTDLGECSFGTMVCTGTTRVCDNSGGALPTPEVCNGKDDDCDGKFDETDMDGTPPVGAGEPCRVDGSGVVHYGPSETVDGECQLGTTVCSGGVIACPDYVGPQPELCDDLDQDCDGDPLNNVPITDARLGLPCPGNDTGLCSPGTTVCMGAEVVCTGVIGPSAELCDGLDNDCDGMSDDGEDEPGLGEVCGIDVGACTMGTMQCTGGSMQCAGQISPMPELCDGLDNDCDEHVDEDFQLQTNVNRCGSCNNACSFANATPKCVAGQCEIAACLPNYHDDPQTPEADCNIGPCVIAGVEICNGKDDDCDGQVDEGLTAPTGVCNVVGACAGAVAVCQGSSGWVCSKLPQPELCNGLDDNCNGQTDEGFGLGANCSAPGVGACATAGKVACNQSGSGTECVDTMGNPVTTGTPVQEVCNGRDDDCDGKTDEPCDGVDENCVTDSWVSLGGGVDIYKYEASRPDATSTSSGASAARACSSPSRLPWTNVSYLQALAACKAADPNGRLCLEGEWEQACMDDPGGTCTWGFPGHPSCNTYSGSTCNGFDYDVTPVIQASGQSGASNSCYRGSSMSPATQIFELSGNVKEYVMQRGTGGIPVRGGAHNNTQDGLRCGFDFSVWPNNSPFTNVGFRCCRSPDPLPPACATFHVTGLDVTHATLATHTITVPEMIGPITDVNVVSFMGTHNTMSQVHFMELVGPDDTTVRLTNQGYCGSNDNWSYVFDQEAAQALPPTSASPCGSGQSFRPHESLAVFNGKTTAGSWTIRVGDNNSSGSSSSPHINSWGVQICVDQN